MKSHFCHVPLVCFFIACCLYLAAVPTVGAAALQADVSLNQEVSLKTDADGNGSISSGDTVTVTMTVANAGPATATGVAVENVLPPGYFNVTNISNSGLFAAGKVTWSGLTIAAGGAQPLTFDAVVQSYGSYGNAAQITSVKSFELTAVNATSGTIPPPGAQTTAFDIPDGSSFSVSNGVTAKTFEFDAGPQVKQLPNRLADGTENAANVIRDGNFFVLDPDQAVYGDEVYYQLNTGAVLRVKDPALITDSGATPPVGPATLLTIAGGGTAVTFEFDTGDGTLATAGSVKIDISGAAGSATAVATAIATAVNSSALSGVITATATLDRVSFAGDHTVYVAPVLSGVDPATIASGTTFRLQMTGMGSAATFEFVRGGAASAGNIPVDIVAAVTTGDVIAAMNSAIVSPAAQAAGLHGATHVMAGNIRVDAPGIQFRPGSSPVRDLAASATEAPLFFVEGGGAGEAPILVGADPATIPTGTTFQLRTADMALPVTFEFVRGGAASGANIPVDISFAVTTGNVMTAMSAAALSGAATAAGLYVTTQVAADRLVVQAFAGALFAMGTSPITKAANVYQVAVFPGDDNATIGSKVAAVVNSQSPYAQKFAAGSAFQRVNFPPLAGSLRVAAADFSGVPAWSNWGTAAGVAPGAIPIPLLAQDSAATIATRIAATVNAAAIPGIDATDTGTRTLLINGTVTLGVGSPLSLAAATYLNKTIAMKTDADGNGTYSPGDTVTFTVTLANSSSTVLSGVAVADAVSAGYTSVSSISNSGALGSGTVTWTGLTIAAGGNLALTYDAVIQEFYRSFAQVTASDLVDPDSTPNNGPNAEDDNSTATPIVTISFGPAPVIVVGGTGTVSATATSGLAVTFSSATPAVCSVSGATVSGLAAGMCTIVANQAGNASNAAAAPVAQSFTIATVGAPLVKTLKYVYQTASTFANGLVNPGGGSCSVSFQYGATTGYGSTTPPVTVSGSSDTPVSTFLAGLGVSNEGIPYHYRTVAVCNGVTYYGNDIAFGSITYNVLENLSIVPTCGTIRDMANFEIVNKNSKVIQISYMSGESFSGVLDLEPNVTYQVFIYLSSLLSLSYNNYFFAMRATNDTNCTSPQEPIFLVDGAPSGGVTGGSWVLALKNNNPAPLTVSVGDGVGASVDVTLPANGVKNVAWVGDAIVSYNGTPYLFYAPALTRWPGVFSVTATPLSSTVTSSDFLVQNNDDIAHTVVLRNAAGTERRYTLPAYGSQQVTVAYGAWDLYLVVPDMPGTAMVGDHIKVASLTPGSYQQGVTALVVNPAAPQQLVAGLFGAGIMKSSDNGATWNPAATPPVNIWIKTVAGSPVAPATLYAATYGSGVSRSSDSGNSWSTCGGQPGNLNTVSLAVAVTGSIYAGTEGGIFTSIDGCSSWSAVNSGLTVDPAKPPVALAIDPGNSASLYAGLDGGGVFRSANSGGSWNGATQQPANLRIKALVIDKNDSSKLYAASYGGGVFKSTDSGVTWAACTNTNLANLNLLTLTIDGSGKLYAGTEAGVFVSTDGCGSWTAMSAGLP